MASNRAGMKFRSVTYPAHEGIDNESHMGKKKRGKLRRMDSVDCDQGLSGETQHQLQISPNGQSQNYFQIPSPNLPSRSNSKRRDLSLEGRLRANQFKQTHSATSPMAPAKPLLRFSDGYLGKTGSPQPGFNQHMRSSSCLPLSKGGKASPKTSTTNLERLVDWQKPSFDRLYLSPSRSQERQDSYSGKQKSHQKSQKKLESDSSTDNQDRPSSQPNQNDPTQTGNEGAVATTSNDTRSRRSQFRRAISLFSLSCDKETERENRAKTSQKILRPPTRHVYRRGLSGLPIECTSRNLGIAY